MAHPFLGKDEQYVTAVRGWRPDEIRQLPPRYRSYYAYAFTYADNTAVVDLASGALDTPFTIQVDAKWTFLAHKLTAAWSDPRFLVQIITVHNGRKWFSSRTPAAAVLGTGNRPFVLWSPYVVPANSTLQVLLSDDSFSTDNRIRGAIHGVAKYPALVPMIGPQTYSGWNHFTHTLRFDGSGEGDAVAAPAASGAATISRHIDGDADMEVWAISGTCVGDFLVDILLSDGERRIFSAPLHGANIGITTTSASLLSGQRPFLLPGDAPLFLPRRTALTVQVTDLTAAANNNIRIAFHGRKLFLPGAQEF